MPVSVKWLVLLTAIVVGPVARSQKVFFEQLTTAKGLPSDYVNTVFRDSKGFLWIATDKGAYRYDGTRFLSLNKDNGLTSNFVNCFAEDPGGNIWLGTMEGGVCKYDGEKVTPYFTAIRNELAGVRQIHFNDDSSFFLDRASIGIEFNIGRRPGLSKSPHLKLKNQQ